MKTGEHLNKCGTSTSEHVCDTCGVDYTVCPAVGLEGDNVGVASNCMGPECGSYDPAHDLDAAFDSDSDLMSRDVVSINALRLRRNVSSRVVSDD